MQTLRSVAFYSALPLAFALAACGSDEAAEEADGNRTTATQSTSGWANVPTIEDGMDVCYDMIEKAIGADTKISEMNASYGPGEELSTVPVVAERGQMNVCSVTYQNPEDPRKLLNLRMNLRTGEFDKPQPIEISVMGNASEFNLEDHIIPLSSVNVSGLAAIMDLQKAELDKVYSDYAWTGWRLSAPSRFHPEHRLEISLSGRLASNDIIERGSAYVSLDGTTMTSSNLMP